MFKLLSFVSFCLLCTNFVPFVPLIARAGVNTLNLRCPHTTTGLASFNLLGLESVLLHGLADDTTDDAKDYKGEEDTGDDAVHVDIRPESLLAGLLGDSHLSISLDLCDLYLSVSLNLGSVKV